MSLELNSSNPVARPKIFCGKSRSIVLGRETTQPFTIWREIRAHRLPMSSEL
ncbi:MAG: hypothetical protein ABI686_05760 [Acidobacteriota bacterium]